MQYIGEEKVRRKLEKLFLLKTILSLVPTGKVVSYKDLSIVLGSNPRAVGKLLSNNDEPIIVPCHRVVYSNGLIGGYTGPGGLFFKEKLLRLEGVQLENNRVSLKSFFNLKKFLEP